MAHFPSDPGLMQNGRRKARVSDMIGELVDGWKLTKKLGEGGTGETYLAERAETGEPAAVKVLFPQASADRALVDKLFADTAAASRVNHVGMVDVFACGVHQGGRAYLVMELLEGKTLTDALIELGAVTDIESFADLGWQLATLLGAAHAAKLVHGALKPDGIFLTFPPAQAPRPLVKVLDFGMGKFSTSVRHSQTGSLLGAPLYMSPEIGRGLGSVDQRADVYSLGCILFEMLCGRPPFVREGAGELIIAHTTETPPSVSSLEPSAPQAIDNLIGRMLAKNPAVRPQGMAEVAAVLEKFFKCPAPGASLAPAAPPPAAPMAPPRFAPPPQPAAPVAPPPLALPQPVFPAVGAASPTIDAPAPSPAAVTPARRPDPTALLPPQDVALAGISPQSPVAETWVSRVRQRTAILEPPAQAQEFGQPLGGKPLDGSRGATGKPPRRPRSGPPAAGLDARAAPSLNLPVVIATAAIVLAIGAAILLLRHRKAAAPTQPPPAPSERAPARAEPFRPPPPLEPSPGLAPASSVPRPEPAAPGQEAEPEGAAAASAPASRTKPARKGPAKRW